MSALIPVSTQVPPPPLKLTLVPPFSTQVTEPSLVIEMATGSFFASIEKVNAPAGPVTVSGPVYVIVFTMRLLGLLHPARSMGARTNNPSTPCPTLG